MANGNGNLPRTTFWPVIGFIVLMGAGMFSYAMAQVNTLAVNMNQLAVSVVRLETVVDERTK